VSLFIGLGSPLFLSAHYLLNAATGLKSWQNTERATVELSASAFQKTWPKNWTVKSEKAEQVAGQRPSPG